MVSRQGFPHKTRSLVVDRGKHSDEFLLLSSPISLELSPIGHGERHGGTQHLLSRAIRDQRRRTYQLKVHTSSQSQRKKPAPLTGIENLAQGRGALVWGERPAGVSADAKQRFRDFYQNAYHG